MKTAGKWILGAGLVLGWVGGAAGQADPPPAAVVETNASVAMASAVATNRQVDYAVVPGPLYSPSLGWGLMVIPMATFQVDPADTVSPASSMSAFLLFTENDSFVAGIGPKLYLREDTWRLSGGLGYGNVQQKFYGIGATDPDEYVSMSSEVGMVQAQALYRVWTNTFVGPSLQYSRNRFRGEDAAADAVLAAAGLNYDYDHNTVPGLVVQWDTREDQVAPRKGIFVDTNLRGASEDMGSTSSFQRLGLAYSQYRTLWKDPAHVLAWLATVETGFGDVPFDEYPDLGGQKALRGYVHGEFTDKNMMAAQVEYRWNAWKKLGLTGFFGVGKVFPEWDEFDGADWLPAGGVGLRYLVIPDRRMNARLDLAWGELGFNFYFSVGEAF